MKKHTTWIWTVSALAVLAAPMTLDQVMNHPTYRTIASDVVPVITTDQETIEVPVVTEVVKTDAEKLAELKAEISTFKSEGNDHKEDIIDAYEDLAGAPNDASSIKDVTDIEPGIKEHIAKLPELERKLKELENSTTLTAADFSSGRLELDEAKKTAEEISSKLAEANKLIADSAEALRLKEELDRKRDEELVAKTEELKKRNEELAVRDAELKKQLKEHELFVCKAEARDASFMKQIEQFKVEQQQFNQVLFRLASQQQQPQLQPNVWPYVMGGPNYFGPQHTYSMPYNQYGFGFGNFQMPSQSLSLQNPWAQPQTINNYYGHGQQGMGGMQFSQPLQPQSPFGFTTPMGMNQVPQPFLPFQQSNFGFAPMTDQSAQAAFGGFTPQS